MSSSGWRPVQVAEQLAKVAKQVVDAEAEAARRGPLLRAAEELQGARAECAWLCAYDADDARYKARQPDRVPCPPLCPVRQGHAGPPSSA